MKIQPIMNFGRSTNSIETNQNNTQFKQKAIANTISNNNMLMDYTNNGALIRNKQSSVINFQGTSNIESLIKAAKKLPLEEKLSILFNDFLSGDVIVVSKNIQEAQKGLKSCIDQFDSVIKRIIQIEDGALSVPLAFNKNRNGDILLTNIGEKDISLSTGKILEPLNPGDSFYIIKDDTIIDGKRGIPIKGKSRKDVYKLGKLFSTTYDFEKIQNDKIQKTNMETISLLAKEHKPVQKGLSFSDIGGLDEIIDKLKRGILYPVKYPSAYNNIKVNHGTILYGPPGTGKTLIAQALANETNANFIKLNGLELESKWVGESEENWRTLFNQAKENQPSIIFLDEFDAIAKKRSGRDEYGDKVVNQILTLMSDIEKDNDNIFIIAATNRINALDDAIVRSGRFGKHIEVPAPDIKGIRQIFTIHTKNKDLDSNLDIESLTKSFYDKKMTGADIAQVVSDAHSNAFERCGIYEKMENNTFTQADLRNVKINQEDFNKAIETFDKKRTTKDRNPIGFNRNKTS